MKNLRKDFLIHTNFLTMITITLFFCCEKVFILKNTWMIGKNSMKCSLPVKEHFYSHLNIEDITYADYAHAKRV